MHFPIRLLLVIDELDIGGTEQQIFELVRKIDRSKYLPMVCCFRPGRIAKEIEGLGVQVFTLPKRNKFDLQLLPALVQLLRRERIDLIQTYLFTANTWARVAAILARIPLIVTSERNVNMWEERYKQLLGKLLDRWTQGTIANSSAVKDYLIGKGIAAQKIHVVSNGVDLKRFSDSAPQDATALKKELGLPPDHQIVSMIVRLESAKDVSTFLRAAALVAQRHRDVSFLIIGGGSLRNELEREAAQLGLQERVIFAGPRRDVPQLLSISTVSALSSLKEGMSNTIMESMAAGKPVIATQVGGNAELIVDGTTGFLVPTRNPEAFAEALYKLLVDPDGARRMGEEARERITQLFSAEALVAKTERLYDALLNQAPVVSPTLGTPTLHGEAPTVAFIVSQFPRYVDAYFLREVAALAARGLQFRIFSLLNFNGKIVHKDAQALLPRTVYIPFFFSFALWQAHVHFLRQTPGRYLNALWTILRGCWQKPRSLAKALAVFPKSVYFAKLVKDQHLAHVHANWASHPAASALIITKLTGVSWSFAGHASDIFLDTTMLREKIRAAKFVVTCTRYNKEYLATVGGLDTAEKIVANYHGVDLTKFIPAPRQPHARFTILAVGTLLPCKGLPDLIAACRVLQQRGFAFECLIAGDGPERPALEKLIQQNGLAEQVKILGYVSQEALIPLYQQADVVALPALSESHFGIPNVLLEAMAVETPAICTPLPSLVEVFEDGRNGIYVPEHAPHALADAFIRLMQNPALGSAMGKAGRQKIEELFDTEKNVDVLANLFQPISQQPTVTIAAPRKSAAPVSIEPSSTTLN